MCITSLEKSERRLRPIGYYHRQKKEKFDGPETGSLRTTDRDIRFNILIVAKTILEREAKTRGIRGNSKALISRCGIYY